MKEFQVSDIKALGNLMSSTGTAVILTHTHPDGDAVGSSCALKHYLEDNFGTRVRLVYCNLWADTLSFVFADSDRSDTLVYDDAPELAKDAVLSAEVLYCLDFNDLSRLDALSDVVASASCPKVLVDHHMNPCREVFSLVFSDCEVSSASELLFFLLEALSRNGYGKSGIGAESARSLMTGMTTDTNNFANSVFPSTLQMASRLLAMGVDRDEILEHVYNSYRENRLRAIGCLLDRHLVITDKGVAYTIITKEVQEEFGLREGELEGYVNMPLAIDAVKLSITLKQDDSFFRVSVRSKKGWSANVMAKRFFHGGGHECASGGRLFCPGDIQSWEEAELYVEKAIRDYYE